MDILIYPAGPWQAVNDIIHVKWSLASILIAQLVAAELPALKMERYSIFVLLYLNFALTLRLKLNHILQQLLEAQSEAQL